MTTYCKVNGCENNTTDGNICGNDGVDGHECNEKCEYVCDTHDKLEQVYEALRNIENEDETIDKLQEAMDYYCSTWDKCVGFKKAIFTTLEDQYNNHAGEQDDGDLDKLLEILTK